MFGRVKSLRSLNFVPQYNKISWQNGNPYNQRWQFKWKHAYYGYTKEGQEHTFVNKPQDGKQTTPLYWTWFQDVALRWVPGIQTWIHRRNRVADNFSLYVLPGTSLFFYQFTDLAFGFKVLSFLPLVLFYVRLRDRSLDPDFKETYLRDMMWNNQELTKYFNEETMHIMDYDCEYDQGFQCPEKFPEFQNKVFQFFNTDTSMCTGHFKIGDVETGAVANLKFKTMPVPGKFRYQVGEPFYFYDLRAEVTHNGVFKEIVLVDEKETLKRIRPFLFLI